MPNKTQVWVWYMLKPDGRCLWSLVCFLPTTTETTTTKTTTITTITSQMPMCLEFVILHRLWSKQYPVYVCDFCWILSTLWSVIYALHWLNAMCITDSHSQIQSNIKLMNSTYKNFALIMHYAIKWKMYSKFSSCITAVIRTLLTFNIIILSWFICKALD